MTCDVRVFSCVCHLDAGHETKEPHECSCGGRWYGENEEELIPVTLPFIFDFEVEEGPD